MIKVFPAILTDNPVELTEMLEQSESQVGRVQIDIIDGVFADNKTVDPADISTLTYNINYDFHLMVNEPIKWVEKSFRAGAERIIGQIELMGDQLEFLNKVRSLEVKGGLAVDYETEIEELEPDVFSELDVILVMSYPAGFAGQNFRSGVLKKIKEIYDIRQKRGFDFKICIDGGISKENIADVAKAGADEVVVGRRIFDGGVQKNIESYIHAAER